MEYKFLSHIYELHPQQADFFRKVIDQQQLGHAYLFYGYEGVGKEAFAIELAHHLLCEQGPIRVCGSCQSCQLIQKFWHPDLNLIFPTPSKTNLKEQELIHLLEQKSKNPFIKMHFPGKNTYISIDTIRQLKNFVYEQPHQSDKKIVLIFDADLLRIEAANALLKILEEPPPYVYFILVTSHISRLLPTILSRCQTVHFERPSLQSLSKIVKQFSPDLEDSQILHLLKFSNLNLKKVFMYTRMDIDRIQHTIEALLRSVAAKDTQLFVETFYNEFLSQSGEKISLFFEWMLPALLDIYYKCVLKRDEIRMPFFAKLYSKIQIPEENTDVFLDLIESIEMAKQELDSEFNLNESLIIHSCFNALYNYFFQVPEKIEE